jgi:hypothetical protein
MREEFMADLMSETSEPTQSPKQPDLPKPPDRWAAAMTPALPIAQYGDWEPWIRLTMILLISIVLLAAGLHLILSKKYKLQSEKWGYSFVSLVVGFWFGRGL